MVPILSGIIVGAGGDRPVSRGRAFALSLAYVLGMAITYTIAGAAFAAAGPAGAGVLPEAVDHRAVRGAVRAARARHVRPVQPADAGGVPVARRRLSNRQKQGTLVGTAVMGALSSLIVTACVAPPLVAALAVIGQSGDVFRGGAALFALSLGMGAPLLLVGASAGQLLPKAGPWMDAVKDAFGVLMLGVAIWMLSPHPARPGHARAVGRARLRLGLLPADAGRPRPAPSGPWPSGAASVCSRCVYGVLLLVGALAGPQRSAAAARRRFGRAVGFGDATRSRLAFKRIKSVADLDRELAAAKAAGQP